MVHPTAWVTSTPCGRNRSTIASSGWLTCVGVTWALPPPMIWPNAAFGPITATRRSCVRRERQRRPPRRIRHVAQQHHPFGAGQADQGPVVGVVTGQLRPRAFTRERAHPVHQGEHVERRAAHQLGADVATLDRVDQRLATAARRPRHLEVEPGGERLGGRVQPEPVAHHQAVEAPLAAEHAAQHRLAVRGERSVDPVVRGHHGEHARLLDHRLERHQVQLAQRSLVDLRVDRHAFELGVVADEVLDTRRHALGLQTLHVSHRDARREVGVLAHALEVAATGRSAVEVDGRRQQDTGALGLRLAAQHLPDPLDEVGFPRRGERRAARHVERRRAVEARAARPDRAIAHPERWDAQAIDSGPCARSRRRRAAKPVRRA